MATYTYDADFDVAKDVVRFLIQDTGPSRWKFSDEEVGAFLPVTGAMAKSTNQLAAASLCDQLVTRYSGQVDVSEGGASMSGSQLSAQYRQLAKDLRARGGLTAMTLVSPTGDDWYGPSFTRQMGDRYGINSSYLSTPAYPDGSDVP